DLRRRLPYPGNVTTSVDRAAAAIVDGLARRRSRVYVPRAVIVANWAKAALNSPAAWPWMRRFAAQVVPTLEREFEALGRHDQRVLADRQVELDGVRAHSAPRRELLAVAGDANPVDVGQLHDAHARAASGARWRRGVRVDQQLAAVDVVARDGKTDRRVVDAF